MSAQAVYATNIFAKTLLAKRWRRVLANGNMPRLSSSPCAYRHALMPKTDTLRDAFVTALSYVVYACRPVCLRLTPPRPLLACP